MGEYLSPEANTPELQLAELLPSLTAVVFSSDSLAQFQNGEYLHIPPAPGSITTPPSPEVCKGRDLADRFRTFTSPDPSRISDIGRFLIKEIYRSHQHVSDFPGLKDQLPDRPSFFVPENITYPDQICPILNSGFAEKFPLGEKFMLITSQIDQSCVWVIPDNHSDNSPPYPVSIRIEKMDRAWVDNKTWYRYAYYVGYSPSLSQYYAPIDTASGRRVINYKWRLDNPPGEDNSYFFSDTTDEFSLHPTADRMHQKDSSYSSQTLAFRERMRQADYSVRTWIRPDNIDKIINVIGAVHRQDAKNGREHTRRCLGDLRRILGPHLNKSTDLDGLVLEVGLSATKELSGFLDDIESDLNGPGHPDSTVQYSPGLILDTLEDLYRVEACYLRPVYTYPWNNQGPEPFDALVEVLWFRYDFRDISGSYEAYQRRLRSINQAAGRLYRNAWGELREDYVFTNVPDWWLLFSSPRQVPVPAALLQQCGNVADYLDQYSLHRLKNGKIAAGRVLAQPLGLTRLLWSTLKWAQPRPGRALRLDLLDFDPEASDEHRPDTRHPHDLQGRTLLSGENLPGLADIGHEQTAYEEGDAKDMFVRVSRAVAALGLTVGSERINQIVSDQLADKELDYVPARESAREFRQATSAIPLRNILDICTTLPPVLQAVIYSRLGYSHPLLENVPSGRRVGYAIGKLFNGNSGLYYRSVRLAATVLVDPPGSDVQIHHLAQELDAISRQINDPGPKPADLSESTGPDTHL